MRKFVTVSIALAALIATAAVAFLLPGQQIAVPSSATHDFTVDLPMGRARKILVRTDAAKKIVAGGNAKLLGQEWLDMAFKADRPLLNRDWRLSGQGEMTVQTSDDYLGEQELTLLQSLDVTTKRLHVTNRLKQPASGPIAAYDSELELMPDETGRAFFRSRLSLRIDTTANWLIRSTVESRIKSAAQQSLKEQERAIREVIAEHTDKLLILPKFGSE